MKTILHIGLNRKKMSFFFMKDDIDEIQSSNNFQPINILGVYTPVAFLPIFNHEIKIGGYRWRAIDLEIKGEKVWVKEPMLMSYEKIHDGRKQPKFTGEILDLRVLSLFQRCFNMI